MNCDPTIVLMKVGEFSSFLSNQLIDIYHCIIYIKLVLDEIHSKENKNNDNDDEDFQDDVNDAPIKTREFWFLLQQKLKQGDTAFVKDLVRKNQLNMKDKNPSDGRTLIMYAVQYGHYDLVAMCITVSYTHLRAHET